MPTPDRTFEVAARLDPSNEGRLKMKQPFVRSQGHPMNQHNPSGNDLVREVAGIFAAGILRLRARQALAAEQPSAQEKISKSGQNGLEVSEETVLSVQMGKRFPRLRERSEHVD